MPTQNGSPAPKAPSFERKPRTLHGVPGTEKRLVFARTDDGQEMVEFVHADCLGPNGARERHGFFVHRGRTLASVRTSTSDATSGSGVRTVTTSPAIHAPDGVPASAILPYVEKGPLRLFAFPGVLRCSGPYRSEGGMSAWGGYHESDMVRFAFYTEAPVAEIEHWSSTDLSS